MPDHPDDRLQPGLKPTDADSAPESASGSGYSVTASHGSGEGLPSPTDEGAAPPERVGPHRVEEEIGRGGMGVVYRARDERLDRAVAIKALPPSVVGDPRRRARFEREARLLALVSHPNLPAIHSVEEVDGRLYLVLELVEGESLSDRLAGGALPLRQSLRICAQVAAAVEAAHERGVVHRDLKPANVKVTSTGLAKVLDFGLAKLLDENESGVSGSIEWPDDSDLTLDGALLGTLPYMSPEQLAGQAVDERADSWAFGCLLDECLTGRRTWGVGKPAERARRIREDEPDWDQLPADTPDRVRRLLQHCLAKDPRRRLRRMRDAQVELEAALEELDGRATRPRVGNLPRQLTSFLGRRAELERLRELLEATPLVTVAGSGGCGKTRLALEAARGMQAELKGGAWQVDLSTISLPQQVAPAVAATLQVEVRPGTSVEDSLQTALAEASLLLVLDNCEHLVEPVAELSERLLRTCPGLQVLATSREPLELTGERVLSLGPLALPPGTGETAPTAALLQESEAAGLFLERAGAADDRFELTDANAPAVAEICRRLDGLPLALELAAARLRSLSLEQLADRLDDRFRLLGKSTGPGPARHQTLRALVDWSHEQLHDLERVVLRRLAVFSGPFTLEAAEQVVAGAPGPDEHEVLDLLSRLVERSLVVVERNPSGIRYRLLETIRAYGAEKLGEAGERSRTRQAHRARHAALVAAWAPRLNGPERLEALAVLDADRAELEAGLSWPAEGTEDADARLVLAACLLHWWRSRGRLAEGLAHCESVLSDDRVDDADATRRAQCLATASALAGDIGEVARSIEWGEEAWELASLHGDLRLQSQTLRVLSTGNMRAGELDLSLSRAERALELAQQLGDALLESWGLGTVANAAWMAGERDRVRELRERGLAIARRLGDDLGVAQALGLIGIIDLQEGNMDAAIRRLEESLALRRRIKDRTGQAVTLVNLSRCRAIAGDQARAREPLEEALRIFRSIGGHEGLGVSLNNLAEMSRTAGDLGRARELYRQSLATSMSTGDGLRLIDVLENLGRLDETEGWFERSARIFGGAEAMRLSAGADRDATDLADHETHHARLLETLGEQAFEAERKTGAALSNDELTQLALSDPA